jgi:hypothetical protein
MGVTVSSNTTYRVTSGSTPDTGDIVLLGGTMYVDSGGTASGRAKPAFRRSCVRTRQRTTGPGEDGETGMTTIVVSGGTTTVFRIISLQRADLLQIGFAGHGLQLLRTL